MNLFFKKIKNNQGFSFIELVVSITLFSTIVLSSTQIFKMVNDGQRTSVSAQNMQENLRYAMEKMSKEIRMAQISNKECDSGGIYKIYNTFTDANGKDVLSFKNKDGECITYYLDLEKKRLKIMVSAPIGGDSIDEFITPAKIEVSNLKFFMDDDEIGAFHSKQPRITMMIDAKAIGLAVNEQKMKIQMTVSSRYYE